MAFPKHEPESRIPRNDIDQWLKGEIVGLVSAQDKDEFLDGVLLRFRTPLFRSAWERMSLRGVD